MQRMKRKLIFYEMKSEKAVFFDFLLWFCSREFTV